MITLSYSKRDQRQCYLLNSSQDDLGPCVDQYKTAFPFPWKDEDKKEYKVFTLLSEGNGNPLRCSCLENPRDGGAWWAAVYGVAQSQTRLKRLSSSSSGGHCFLVLWTAVRPPGPSDTSGQPSLQSLSALLAAAPHSSLLSLLPLCHMKMLEAFCVCKPTRKF